MTKKALVLVGVAAIAAVGLYVAAVVLGGILDPHYSHIRNDISALTGSQAPNAAALAPIFIAYNVVVFAFSVALYRASSRTRLFRIAITLFAVAALSGIGQVTFFREDSAGSPATIYGALHIVLAGLSSILALAGALLYGFAFRRDITWRKLSTVSFLAAGAVLLTAPAAALSVGGPYMGLFERITIGVYLAWVLVVGIYSLWRASVEVPSSEVPSRHAA